MTRSPMTLAVAASAILAVALIASPLTVVAAVATPLCLARLARGLPESERRFLIALLSTALLARVGLIAAQFLRGLPLLNDMSVGALAGDESYYLSRALRGRDLLLGYAATHYDFFVVNDEYGQTSYLNVLTWLQVIFGPTPFSVKIVNGLLFVCGSGILFRIARSAFGTLPSFTGLTVLLFVPSLLFSSVSLLKESAYFFATAVFIGCSWRAILAFSSRHWRSAVQLSVALAVMLFVVDGLRRGGLALMGGGLLVALAMWIVFQSGRRAIIATAAAVVAITTVFSIPSLHDRFISGVQDVAKMHAGHVFTIGHVYKLMDPEFYVEPTTAPRWDLHLDDAQALRFLIRAAVSFVVTPWPWEMRSAGELALLPEHIAWWIVVVMLPFGIREGWRANALATALFLGFAIPTAIVVALTNGNVGTLFRMRGLVTPCLLWIGALGMCAVGERFASGLRARSMALSQEPAL